MTPDQYTNKEFFIEVGDGHQLYVHDWGNPKGLPVVFLHGGPGGSVNDKDKARFDPKIHHVIFFDQRGCGKSLPYASLKHNTTDDLVEDIRRIANQAKFKQFVIVGGSWGACLALAYGVKYPKSVLSLVIDGVFTGSHKEIDYLDKGGFKSHFPDAWDRYLSTVPKANRNDPSGYHYKRMIGEDEKAAKESACAYQNLEMALLSLDDRFVPNSADDPTYDPSGIKIEAHYMQNACFMPDGHILNNAHRLTMPIWMVQGRYDMVCPPMAAYELNKRLANGHLVLTISNHRREHESSAILHTILLQLGDPKR